LFSFIRKHFQNFFQDASVFAHEDSESSQHSWLISPTTMTL